MSSLLLSAGATGSDLVAHLTGSVSVPPPPLLQPHVTCCSESFWFQKFFLGSFKFPQILADELDPAVVGSEHVIYYR